MMILICGPSGVMVPPLFMRTDSSGGKTPGIISDWLSPAGADSGTLNFLANAGPAPGARLPPQPRPKRRISQVLTIWVRLR